MALLRELTVAFHGSDLLVLLGLGLWLLGGAAGALAGHRRGAAGEGATRLAFLAFAALTCLSAVGFRALGSLAGIEPGAWPPLGKMALASALLLLPPAALAGALFQRAARGFAADGGTLPLAYALESAGCLLGGALSTAMLALGAPNLAAAGVAGLAALAAACRPWRGRPRWLLPLALPAALPLAAGLALAGPLDRALTRLGHPTFLATRDTPYGRITLDASGEQIAWFQDGALVWESQGVEAEGFVALAALQVAAPRRVLLLGGAARGLLPELLLHAPERVDVVEIDPATFDLARTALPARERAALADPRVRAVVADPRRHVRAGEPYDLVLLDLPEPSSGATARFGTAEFLADCALRLAPGGVLALRMPGAENLWSPTLTWRNAAIQRALAASFADVLALPGAETTWLASQARLERDPALLAARLAARGLAPRLVSPAWLRYRLEGDRVAEVAARMAASPAPPNTDDHPVCHTLTQFNWLGRFVPGLALLDLPAFLRSAARPLAVAGLALAALAALGLRAARRSPRVAGGALALAAGFLGMTVEGVLLLRYQLAEGALFGDLGLLLTAFMAGLAAGGLALDRLGRRPLAPWRARALVLGCAAVPAATALLQIAGARPSLPDSALLLAAAGASTAALFGLASLPGPTGERAAIGPLYALDLLGGALGALAAGLVLVPLLGLSGTAGVAAAVAMLVLVAV